MVGEDVGERGAGEGNGEFDRLKGGKGSASARGGVWRERKGMIGGLKDKPLHEIQVGLVVEAGVDYFSILVCKRGRGGRNRGIKAS